MSEYEVTKPITVASDYTSLLIVINSIEWNNTNPTKATVRVSYFNSADDFKSGKSSVFVAGFPSVVTVAVDEAADTIQAIKEAALAEIAASSKGLFLTTDIEESVGGGK